MSETGEVKLEPKVPSVSAVSEDLITQPSVSENYLSGGCKSELEIKSEAEQSIVNSTVSDETSTSLHLTDSPDQLPDTKILLAKVIKQEHSHESSSSSVFPSSSQLHNAESRCIPSYNSVKKEPIYEVIYSTEQALNLNDVKEEDESDSETSNASSFTQLTDADRTTEQDMIISSQPAQSTGQHNRCPMCKMNFSNFQALKRHLQRKHVNSRQHRCTQCEKSYNDSSDLIQHIKHVHGDKTYKCHMCDYSCKYRHCLKSHISAVHLEERPHKCLQCDACFSQNGKLSQHIKSVHNREKPYECLACDKKFSHRRDRDIHWRSVHCGDKPCSCDKCDYKCSKKSDLTRHQRAVHEGLKSFICAQCEYKCSSKSSLKRHKMTVHSPQKPYSCRECSKDFSEKSKLREHIDSVHRGLKAHLCTECSSRFSRNRDLQSHIKAVHRKERPHSCSVCSRSFARKFNLSKHIEVVHN